MKKSTSLKSSILSFYKKGRHCSHEWCLSPAHQGWAFNQQIKKIKSCLIGLVFIKNTIMFISYYYLLSIIIYHLSIIIFSLESAATEVASATESAALIVTATLTVGVCALTCTVLTWAEHLQELLGSEYAGEFGAIFFLDIQAEL